MVFERVESSLKQDSNAMFNISDGVPASPSPFATPRPTWIDMEFLRRGINIKLFEQLEKKYKNHAGMGYFAFKSANAEKRGRAAVVETPQYRTDFREKVYPRELIHGISWIMDLSRFVKITVESEDHNIVLLTSIVRPDRSRPYYQRTQQIWKYARMHQYSAAHCFHNEMMETTKFNFSLNDFIWKPLCIRGAFQKRDFSKTDYVLWIDEEAFIRPKYQHIPITHFTNPISIAFPIIVQDTGDVPDLRVILLRNIAAGQKIVYFWILEIYLRIWCKMGICKPDSNMGEMAFCSVYIDELMVARNAQKSDQSIDRLNMKHTLRQVIDSNVGKPFVFFDNFVSFFVESLGKFGVHSQFSAYDHWSEPIRFLGTLKEPTGALGAIKEKKMLGPNEQVARKAEKPSMWFFASRLGDPKRSFISIEEKYLNETVTNNPEMIDSLEKKVITEKKVIESPKKKLEDRSKKNLPNTSEKKLPHSSDKEVIDSPNKKVVLDRVGEKVHSSEKGNLSLTKKINERIEKNDSPKKSNR